ncbi:MAG: SLC45 family MFS transporter, partial [Erysipelotrichaceae bacterium]|nr:SLC45 family MFS transporter [Erysipelotrichaceae bacterium]
ANGIINIMGYLGGAAATVIGIPFALSKYLGSAVDAQGQPIHDPVWYKNIWTIEIPFLVGSVLMVISAVFLFIKIKENKIAVEVAEDMRRGEEHTETADKVVEEGPMSKANLRMLWLILIAEFFWFMADNGIATFMTNYAIYYLKTSSASSMINTIVGGVGSVIGFAVGGIIASKIGRKWTVVGGLGLTLVSYVLWAILTFSTNIAGSGSFPFWIYIIWFVKGFGMSLVHVNSFPMVVELCPNSKIGAFTGYYYASSMAAQTITPIALGALMLIPSFGWQYLPIYALVCVAIAVLVALVLKNVKVGKLGTKKGLAAFDQED